MLKENIEQFKIKLQKIFYGKILGKKYIRSGKCLACGRCCQSIYVRHTNNIIKDEEEFNRLKSQHFFYSYLKIVDKNETGLVFECTKLDKEKGICTAYNKRASICKKYPQEEIFMMGGIITDDCGYKFNPIVSFEEVFNKVKQNCTK